MLSPLCFGNAKAFVRQAFSRISFDLRGWRFEWRVRRGYWSTVGAAGRQWSRAGSASTATVLGRQVGMLARFVLERRVRNDFGREHDHRYRDAARPTHGLSATSTRSGKNLGQGRLMVITSPISVSLP